MLLDVNMGAPLADEAELMVRAVTLIQRLTDLPLVIDSSIPEVLEAGLAAYQGKALVNSVTAEDERLHTILPLVKRYGAAVIGLPNDEEQIPDAPEDRLVLARKLIRTATDDYQIPIEDIVIDPLAMPVGADTGNTMRTLETLALVRDEFGVNTTLGASNLSFGMPDRHALTAAFLPLAAAHGPDQRDHGRPDPAGGHGGAGRRPAARPRRLGRRLDRGVPRREGGRRGRGDAGQAHEPAGRPPVQRPPGAGAAGGHPLRRGELERHRDRLHLRRPRHLQEVPHPVQGRPAAADQPRPARLHRAGDQGRLAARLPHPGRPPTPTSRCRR